MVRGVRNVKKGDVGGREAIFVKENADTLSIKGTDNQSTSRPVNISDGTIHAASTSGSTQPPQNPTDTPSPTAPAPANPSPPKIALHCTGSIPLDDLYLPDELTADQFWSKVFIPAIKVVTQQFHNAEKPHLWISGHSLGGEYTSNSCIQHMI